MRKRLVFVVMALMAMPIAMSGYLALSVMSSALSVIVILVGLSLTGPLVVSYTRHRNQLREQAEIDRKFSNFILAYHSAGNDSEKSTMFVEDNFSNTDHITAAIEQLERSRVAYLSIRVPRLSQAAIEVIEVIVFYFGPVVIFLIGYSTMIRQ